MTKIESAVSVLADAREKVKDILDQPEHQLHKLRVEDSLNREISRLSLSAGFDPNIGDQAPLGPATTIGGKKINRHNQVTVKDLQTTKSKVDVLKEKVETAMVEFLKVTDEEILTDYEDTVIRGVAKKVGLQVTKDKPEKIDLPFIEEVKDYIRKYNVKNQLDPDLS